jgi:AcrR family transcriptional regulator
MASNVSSLIYGHNAEPIQRHLLRDDATGGGFATRALAEEKTVRSAIERILTEAIATYTAEDRPQGCMVVSAATNCSKENERVQAWLAEYRRRLTASLIERLETAITAGELPPSTDAQALGDYYATVLHGLSVQARDGVSKERLLATVPMLLDSLE